MNNFIVAGSGTDVGKTVVSAILATLMNGDYWKPIQCGEEKDSDTAVMKTLIDAAKHHIYAPAYSFKAPLSPHHAARLESISICPNAIILPQTARPLIIEGAGGIFSPISTKAASLDLLQSWNGKWVIVSKHYLGSINHTLLTLDALKRRDIPVVGLIFNGEPNPDSEAAILGISRVPLIGRLLPEAKLNSQTIQRYAKKWKPRLAKLIP